MRLPTSGIVEVGRQEPLKLSNLPEAFNARYRGKPLTKDLQVEAYSFTVDYVNRYCAENRLSISVVIDLVALASSMVAKAFKELPPGAESSEETVKWVD